MTTTAQLPKELRDFYEDPAVPVASGASRSLRQARMLAAALGTGKAHTILDIGCGDGTAAATAAPSSRATASSASTGPRTP